MKGTISVGGSEMPIELFTKAPNKRVSISNGQSFPAFRSVNSSIGISLPRHERYDFGGRERDANRAVHQGPQQTRLNLQRAELHRLPICEQLDWHLAPAS